MKKLGNANIFTNAIQKFGADREEYTKIFLLFGYLFCIVSASTIGRTAADTLFLSRFDSSKLSLMYLPQAAALLLAGFIFQKVCTRLRTDQLVLSVITLVSMLTLGSRLLVDFGFQWVFPVIYVGYDVFNFLMIVCFWQFATAIMDQRKAKRMIGLVGSGGIVGGIVSGFGLKLLVGPLGTENLIFIYAGLQFLCLILVRYHLHKTKDRQQLFSISKAPVKKQASASRPRAEGKEGLFKNVPHLKYVALMAGTLVISLTFIDFQFKVILRESLQNEALAGFMGSFYGFAGLLALFIQFFVSGRLITRFGVMTAILVFPIVLFAGSFAVLLMPVLAMAVMVKGSDKVVGDTIYSSVSQLIMFPISPEWRGRAKGFLDGVVRNGAKGVAAISLIVLTKLLTVHQFSYLILALIACCIFAAIRIKAAYLKMLLATLQTREIDLLDTEQLDLMDPASIQLLINALRSEEKQQAIYAFRMLRGLEQFDLNPYVAELLRHPVVEVRTETLKYIQQTIPPEGEHELEPLLQSPIVKVKSNAIMALSAYAKDDQVERISGFLEEADVRIKAAAIAGLIKYYGIEGMFQAVGTLKSLIESGREEERTAMASLFGKIGIASFYKPLIQLLQDNSAHVQVYALKSAAVLRVPELAPFIIPLMQKAGTRQKAIEALSAYDEAIILPLLEPYLIGEKTILHLPKVFERVGTQRAFDLLLHAYEQVSDELREKILESLVRLHPSLGRTDNRRIENYIMQETSLYWKFTDHGKDLGEEDEFAEVFEAVKQIKAHILIRVFQLLSLIYDPKTVHAIQANWMGGDVRQQANSAEVVDQLMQGGLRTEMTKIMLASPIKRTHTDLSSLGPSLSWLFTQKDAWLNQVIQFAAYQSLNKPQYKEILNLFDVAATKEDQEERVTQLDRVKLLKNVTLFRGLSGKDLSKISEHLLEVSVKKGEAVIREFEDGDSLYLMHKGNAAVFRNNIEVGKLVAGDCFGEMGMLIQSKRTATVIAEEDMHLFRLDSVALYEMIFDQTAIALELMRLLSRRLRSALALVGSTKTNEPEKITPPVNETNNAAITQINNGIILQRMLVLQKISLFAHFAQEDFIRLAHMVEEVIYEPGESICKSGEAGDTMYGIIEGTVQVHRGEEKLAKLSVGQCFGEMAIIDGDPRSADCTAIERTILLQLTKDQVFSFCFQQMNVLKSMMRVLAERLKDMQDRV
ncbi:hypothetical protein EHS13_03635 [Paenibacillus psychroresistens]|uniref:ADP,ATP carrier protein n=1 Tax=Paenibacillus psychroresistens TaxID=1778678 RepID=A0A6B8RF47_9BACL|nr:Npt1/Npt2 family nucleotide transporter [Paenibacillus psychroresistens]QGQ94058.1 hypothetical protein EHS13_03635 [Paenibacillus psychroresistens]